MMIKLFKYVGLYLFAIPALVGTTTVMAQNDNTGTPPAGDDFYSSYIISKLEIGTRITHFILVNDKKGEPNNGSFFGTITQLKEVQNYLPTKLFVQYSITPQFGVGLSYDIFGFDTGDWGIEGPGTGGSDGKASLSGPLFYLTGRYPNSTRFTPFGELGFAIYSASYDADENWASSNGKNVSLNGTKGVYLGAGCDFKISESFQIDLYARYMNISDVNGEWVLLGNKAGDVVFTPSYFAIGFGAKFMF